MYIDLIIKIKNAQAVGRKTVKHQFSRMDKAIAEILYRSGFIAGVETKGRLSKRFLYLALEGRRRVEGVKLWSKPSVKKYTGWREIKPAKGGYGITVITTPKGVMTASEARKEKIGGQLLFEVW